MSTIVLRRHRFKFYFSVIFVAALFLGLGIALIAYFIGKEKEHPLVAKEYPLLWFGVALLFLSAYSIYQYYRNAPKIVLEGDSISFNSKAFSLSDIQEVALTGKCRFPYLGHYAMEAATLFFKDGSTKLIFDDMYENSWELKSYLQQVVIGSKNFAAGEIGQVSRPELDNEQYETFRSNQLTSFRGISLWSLIGFFSYVTITSTRRPTTGLMIFLTLLAMSWFIVHARLMHYFEVSDHYLVVRNHLLPWKRKGFRLNDIYEIVFEDRNKLPNSLRVITKDFKTRLYPAGTLRDKTWLRLKDRLESSGIEVRNECI